MTVPQDTDPDDEIHVERNVTRRRGGPGRRPLPASKRREPFSVRINEEEIRALYQRWSKDTREQPFGAWVRARLLRDL